MPRTQLLNSSAEYYEVMYDRLLLTLHPHTGVVAVGLSADSGVRDPEIMGDWCVSVCVDYVSATH